MEKFDELLAICYNFSSNFCAIWCQQHINQLNTITIKVLKEKKLSTVYF